MTSRAIETLMSEHRVIEQVLGSLETFARRLSPETSEARQRVAEYAEFFREFADRRHHGKEEDRLFAALADHGFPMDGGPVAVMLHEHEMGRCCVRGLAEVGDADGPLDDDERTRVRQLADEFVPLLRAHIQKEDGILFPASEQALPPQVLRQMAEDFERQVDDETGEGAHEQLQRLAGRLVESYPPDPRMLEQTPAFCGSPCGH